VVDETIALFRWLAWASDHIYDDGALGATRRWILRAIHRHGPQTVPALARSRTMRRQGIQPLVDALVLEGMISLRPNPAHKRSRLVVLTREGAARVERMDRVDTRVLGLVARGIAEPNLALTAATLARLRRGFESGLVLPRAIA
jgi:DNA-binding MarR family transcriptional regulator